MRLTLNYESTSKLERIKLIAEVCVESFFQLIGIIITFFMSTRKPISQKELHRRQSSYTPDFELEDRSLDKRSRRSYNPVATKDNDNGLDMD